METRISVILHDELPAGTLCLSTEKWVFAKFRAGTVMKAADEGDTP